MAMPTRGSVRLAIRASLSTVEFETKVDENDGNDDGNVLDSSKSVVALGRAPTPLFFPIKDRKSLYSPKDSLFNFGGLSTIPRKSTTSVPSRKSTTLENKLDTSSSSGNTSAVDESTTAKSKDLENVLTEVVIPQDKKVPKRKVVLAVEQEELTKSKKPKEAKNKSSSRKLKENKNGQRTSGTRTKVKHNSKEKEEIEGEDADENKKEPPGDKLVVQNSTSMSPQVLQRCTSTGTVPEVDTSLDVNRADETKFKIDRNETEFLKLTNAGVTGNDITLKTSMLKNYVEFIELTDDLSVQESNPGVEVASFFHRDQITTGYMYIAPKTLKPLSISTDVRIMLWVLQGEVTVRSTDFETEDGTNYLYGKTMTCGSCIWVPPFTPYMLENRNGDHEAVLGYVMVSP